jgi:integrase
MGEADQEMPRYFLGSRIVGSDCEVPVTAVTGRALNRYNAWAAIRKRAKAAGFLTPVGCHTWRATGITIYLENDGRLEHAQQMAAHESPRTTKLYDRTDSPPPPSPRPLLHFLARQYLVQRDNSCQGPCGPIFAPLGGAWWFFRFRLRLGP